MSHEISSEWIHLSTRRAFGKMGWAVVSEQKAEGSREKAVWDFKSEISNSKFEIQVILFPSTPRCPLPIADC
jgi:hypothetical protein